MTHLPPAPAPTGTAQETPWTPGPWRVEEGTTLVWGACNPDDQTTYGMGFPVAEAVWRRAWSKQDRPDEAEQVANAYLIAAAPRLYKALESARLQIEYLHEKFQETGSGNAVLAQINEALRAARKEPT